MIARTEARLRSLAAAILALGCTLQPPARPENRAEPPVAPVPPSPLEPPPRGEAPGASFLVVQHRRLGNGLPVHVIERHTHPLVELRLVIRSGSATDEGKPGLARLSSEMLKAGGAGSLGPLELLERVESLGTDLEIGTGLDATVLRMNVTSPLLDAALEVLSSVVLSPRFEAQEFALLRDREIERVKSAARGDPDWAASRVLFAHLYAEPGRSHPYSRYDALPAQLSDITLADCRAWYRAHVVPSNAALIIVGDVTPDAALAAAARWLEPFSGGPAPEPTIPLPIAQGAPRILLVDRSGSAQAQVHVGVLGPERQSGEWPALTVADQILGGGVSGRLFLDVRERRSLAYRTRSEIRPVAVGPTSLIVSAGTRTEAVTEAVRALLDHMAAIARHPPSPEEVNDAKAFLADGFLLHLDTVGSVADLAVALEVFGLPDDYYDHYRASVRSLDVGDVATTAGKYYDKVPVVVVAGDARSLRVPLATIAPVTVLDPGQDLEAGGAP